MRGDTADQQGQGSPVKRKQAFETSNVPNCGPEGLISGLEVGFDVVDGQQQDVLGQACDRAGHHMQLKGQLLGIFFPFQLKIFHN